jgi:hypothetical protein
MNTQTIQPTPFLIPQHPAFEERSNAVEDPLVINRLVNNLMYLFNVQPNEDHLTFVLGFGMSHRNDEALKYWVMSQLEKHPMGFDDVLAFLADQLKDQLMQEVCS